MTGTEQEPEHYVITRRRAPALSTAGVACAAHPRCGGRGVGLEFPARSFRSFREDPRVPPRLDDRVPASAPGPAPYDAFKELRTAARRFAESRIGDTERLRFAQTFAMLAAGHYWLLTVPDTLAPPWPAGQPKGALRAGEKSLAHALADVAAGFEVTEAAYLLGSIYTILLPPGYRGELGVFYTPPALAERLLDQVEAAGVDWTTARVLDPACGGGAFLAPVARRMVAALADRTPRERLAHVERHLSGFEIDRVAAWMAGLFLEASLAADMLAAGRRLRLDGITVRNSLTLPDDAIARDGGYDLVIGNPPYGRVTLSAEERQRWARGLYGHANIYGLFTDLAVRLARPGGVVGFVTPAGFLGGEYFKHLRRLLAAEAPPLSIDFVDTRKGVFADVLQETLLAVYRRGGTGADVRVAFLNAREQGGALVKPGGAYALPADPSRPWTLPRHESHVALARRLSALPHRLADLGYEVSTGPLVWNRHKDKLHDRRVRGAIPVIWAECVASDGSGAFEFKGATRNHKLWFTPGPRDQANVVRRACVLLQRTTALEQARRLIAAELPQSFINEHKGAVSVENHLNMIRPAAGTTPAVRAATIARLLNSEAVDLAFRCINGTPAVSAYEVEATPMPAPADVLRIQERLDSGADDATVEALIWKVYGL